MSGPSSATRAAAEPAAVFPFSFGSSSSFLCCRCCADRGVVADVGAADAFRSSFRFRRAEDRDGVAAAASAALAAAVVDLEVVEAEGSAALAAAAVSVAAAQEDPGEQWLK